MLLLIMFNLFFSVIRKVNLKPLYLIRRLSLWPVFLSLWMSVCSLNFTQLFSKLGEIDNTTDKRNKNGARGPPPAKPHYVNPGGHF